MQTKHGSLRSNLTTHDNKPAVDLMNACISIAHICMFVLLLFRNEEALFNLIGPSSIMNHGRATGRVLSIIIAVTICHRHTQQHINERVSIWCNALRYFLSLSYGLILIINNLIVDTIDYNTLTSIILIFVIVILCLWNRSFMDSECMRRSVLLLCCGFFWVTK